MQTMMMIMILNHFLLKILQQQHVKLTMIMNIFKTVYSFYLFEKKSSSPFYVTYHSIFFLQ
jgi:hypothetical protein